VSLAIDDAPFFSSFPFRVCNVTTMGDILHNRLGASAADVLIGHRDLQ